MSTTGRPLGARERRNRRTRVAIVSATAELTVEHGFAGATIARIASRAGVAPRTVSAWFPVKEDILLGPLPEQVERLEAHLEEGDGSAVDRIETWLHEEGRLMAPEGDLPFARYRAISHDPALREREAVLFGSAHGATASCVARELDLPSDSAVPQLFASAVVGMLTAFREDAISDRPGPVPRDIDASLAFLRAGCAAVAVRQA